MQKPSYEKPNFKLYHGNCLDILAEFPENSVDMIFADPPYFLSSGSFHLSKWENGKRKKGRLGLK